MDKGQGKLINLLVLYALNRRLNGVTDTEDLAEIAEGLARDFLDLDGITLFTVDSLTNELEFLYADDLVSEQAPRRRLAMERTIAGEVLRRGRSLIIGDLAAWMMQHGTATDAPSAGSMVSVPIPYPEGDGFLGVASFYRSGTERFNEDERAWLESIADDIGTTLQRTQLFEQYRRDSMYDALTGIYNRAYVETRVEHEIRSQRRYGTVFSVLLLDLDHFKRLNDSYGHATGDEVLRRISEAIRTSIRKVDTVGRYGGEEFVVVLPNTNGNEATAAAEKIREAVAATNVIAEQDTGLITVTVTCGVACAPQDGSDAAELLQVADQRLYEGKAAGCDLVMAESAPPESFESRRRNPRYPVALGVATRQRRILGLEGWSSSGWSACVIEDISRLGARGSLLDRRL